MQKFLAQHTRIINGLAIVSGVAVLLITGLRFLPPAFNHADVIGDLFFNLSIGYLGAWLFNLLVIEIPRGRQRSDAFKTVAYRLNSLASTAVEIRTKLSAATATPIGDDETLMLACAKYDSSKRPDLLPPREMIEEHYDRKLRDFAQVDSLILMYFDVELRRAAETLLNSAFFRLARNRKMDWSNERQLAALATSLGDLAAEGTKLRQLLEATGKAL